MTQTRIESSFLKAAYSVLKYMRRPLSARAITAAAIREGYLDENRPGQTPWQTMKSKLSVHIRKYGPHSVFVRAGPGKFFLRELLNDSMQLYEAPPFGAGPAHERIVAFPQAHLDSIGRFQGVLRGWEPYYESIARGGTCVVIDRMLAEDSLGFKQVITYVLVRDPAGSLLCFNRGVVNRADDMLRGKSCVGFGGHVKAVPPTLFQSDDIALYDSAAQELLEELVLPRRARALLLSAPDQALSVIGVLNDDSSPNGVRHFAFVFELVLERAEAPSVRGREKSINRVRWLTPEAASSESVHRFEFWSQMCLRHFAPDLASATPAFRVRRARGLRRARAICCVGQMGSGKTEAVSLLTREFGFTSVNSGLVVADILGLPPVPATPRAEFQEAAARFVSRPDGPAVLGAELARRTRRAPGRVVIDGLRQPETLEALREALGPRDVSVVYVHAPVDIAYEFYREREDTKATIDDFTARRGAWVEIQVTQMLEDADAALFNWIGRDEYQRVVRAFANQYLGPSAGS